MRNAIGRNLQTWYPVDSSSRPGAGEILKKVLITVGNAYAPASTIRARLRSSAGATDADTGRLAPFLAFFL